MSHVELSLIPVHSYHTATLLIALSVTFVCDDVTDAVSPEDLTATIYHALGIDPNLRIPDRQDRPVPLVEHGRPMIELFG